MSKLPAITSSELVRVVKKFGFVEQRQKGSHLHLKRDSDKRRVTIPIHKGRDIPKGTLTAILKDAGISIEEFLDEL
ncbi:MAG: type II toxin-antitoxin system HicA family toxin [Ignavibacteriaceae bacterium]|nr:type II toxin-antitoxin system HicA family toxin [Ignavibacteriaceae bacterium]